MIKFVRYPSHFYDLMSRYRHKKSIFGLIMLLAASPAFAQGGSCPSNWNSIDPSGNPVSIASYAGIKSCFYASKATGSDSNPGDSEATGHAWAHIPGMQGCTGNCATHSPSAGEGFVMRGGDTWSGGELGVGWGWGGANSSSQIYIGVDQNWFNSSCGSTWCRPVWNESGGSGNAFLASPTAQWWWLDNIEITGMNNSKNGVYVQGASNIRASQLYFHGWSWVGGVGNNVGFFSQGGTGAMADHNVIDGSDSTQNTMNGFYSYWAGIQFNVVKYVVSGLIGGSDWVHDNVLSNAVTSADGDHCNGFFTFNPLSGNYQLIYNNIINMGSSCPGGVQLWFNGNSGTNGSWVGYGFGNIEYNTTGANLFNIGNHGAGNYGTYYIFNNTVDCTNGGCGGTPPVGPYYAVYDQNNHTIGGSLSFDTTPSGGNILGPCVAGAGTGCMDVTESGSMASSQGYTSSEVYPYQPVSSCTQASCPTVNAGANLMTICSQLSSINASAYNACQNATSVGVKYNTGNHTVTNPNATLNPRPSTGTWDVGAYQFAHTNAPPAPSNLSGTLKTNSGTAVTSSGLTPAKSAN